MTIREGAPQKMRVKEFTVRGHIGFHSMFPMDMLRYDRCWPASGAEAAKMIPCNDAVEITLHGLGCTRDRWRSFGWEVL